MSDEERLRILAIVDETLTWPSPPGYLPETVLALACMRAGAALKQIREIVAKSQIVTS